MVSGTILMLIVLMDLMKAWLMQRWSWLLAQRHLVEQRQDPVFDLRFRADFQVAGTRAPGRVTAEFKLVRRWQVTVAAVRKLHDHRQRKRAGPLDRQPGAAKGFAWRRADAQFADAQCLQLDRLLGPAVPHL